MRYTRHILQIIALTVALLAAGQSAWATTKTVTYTITNVSLSSGATGYDITFTRDGAPFETSAPTTYTAWISRGSIGSDISNSGYVSVQLADGFGLSLSWNSGSDVKYINNCFYPSASDKYITYSVSCPEANFFVTHVMMTGYNSNYQQGLLQPYPHYNEPIDYNYDSVWHFSESYLSRYAFGQITLTYSNEPNEYTIRYVDAVHGENGVTNNNPTSYNVTTPTFNITAPSRTGYKFSGFYRDEQHSQAVTLPETVTQGSAATDKARTYYATWTPHTYYVIFDANGGSGTMDTQTFTYDQAQNLTTNAFTRNGHLFNGWSTQSNGGGGSYADGQQVNNLTSGNHNSVTLYAQWVPDYSIWGAGNDGSETHPYTISTTEGLDLLASEVNGGNGFEGKFFVLGNDLTYSTEGLGEYEGNYTAIGTMIFDQNSGTRMYPFKGTFDGRHHSVSGIRIKAGSSFLNDDDQGLIGILVGGTVKNVIVMNADITGPYDLGAIVGDNLSGSLANNYYYACTVNGNTANIGTGAGDVADNNGAVQIYTITPGTDISASATAAVSNAGTSYYAAGTTVTLAYSGSLPEGITQPVYMVNGTPIEGNSFEMPAEDVIISVRSFGITTQYVDAYGMAHSTKAIPLDNTMTTLAEGTYVVNADVTFTSPLTITGDVTLILADDCTMSVGTDNYRINSNAITAQNLTIYGQSGGTGRLTIKCNTGYSISIPGSGYTQHSGNVVIQVVSGSCIRNAQSITLLGGTLDVWSGTSGDILSASDISILGGQFRANSDGNYGINGSITLGYTKATDSIFSTAYNNDIVTIVSGQILVDDNGKTYSGTISRKPKQTGLSIDGKTLRPYYAPSMNLTLVQGTKDGVSAYWGTFYGVQRYTLPEGAAAFTMDSTKHLYRLGTDGRTIPANTAVVIIADSQNITLSKDDDDTTITDHAPGGNILYGGPVTPDSEHKVPVLGSDPEVKGFPYVLSVDSNAVIGFRQYVGTDAIPADKAYYVQ